MDRVLTGLERLAADPPADLVRMRLGLLCNQASVDRRFRHARDLLAPVLPGLCRLFSPQHGFFSEKQDNMVESDHGVDPVTGWPVYSLYGEVRQPTAAMFDGIDALLVDLVDVGTRVYTFAWTVVLCLRTAAAAGVRVVVLDRPNPLGGLVLEGPCLEPGWESFVGLAPVPMRHGLTLGELALLCNDLLGIGADCRVLAAANWRRSRTFPATGLPWVFPSPNMPTYATARVYPGQVLWEGTNVSEGRGTTLPFELFGAPYLDQDAVLAGLTAEDLAGCVLRPICFEPVASKWRGRLCRGFHIHVTDEERFRPFRLSLALLGRIMRLYPEAFACAEPPYEYEFERLPLDLILGGPQVRRALEAGVGVAELEASWRSELAGFDRRRRPYLLYGD